ncbi:MAG: aldolase/citrate lyase family protein [Deltaproteobacteria bacterium]|jgi:4-hydroxy-2-oxoheptanedioate aldolase|nr:aldolase/citrate lyase family protein [Deltaproteobacteria bacterium]
MDTAQLKLRLKNGECLYGPFVRTVDPVVTEIMGYAGFDFVILDTEHGPMNVHQAENLVRAAKLSGAAPVIRIRENSDTMITRALDTGASGVQIPQVNTVESAKYAVESTKFFPKGNRGVCKFTRNAEYSHIPRKEYFQKSNDSTLVVIQIEGMEGVRNIDRILEVPDIDVLFLGPYDLSQSLGLTGQVTHPKVLSVIEEITKKARDKNVTVGSFADKKETILMHKNMGVQYLSYLIDTGLIYEAAKNEVESLRNSL